MPTTYTRQLSSCRSRNLWPTSTASHTTRKATWCSQPVGTSTICGQNFSVRYTSNRCTIKCPLYMRWNKKFTIVRNSYKLCWYYFHLGMVQSSFEGTCMLISSVPWYHDIFLLTSFRLTSPRPTYFRPIKKADIFKTSK